jgi:glycosyltransferase involved in cell wall biosynthesis
MPIVRCSVALPDAIRAERAEIVTVARLVPKKGIDLLIGAFAAADVGDWTLRILGDGRVRIALEALAARLGVADRIAFEGARPHPSCLAATAEAGLFVLPCRTAANGDMDGIPVVLMEAMAAGRAVIAGDLPAIRELIDHDRSGLLVAPNDPAALAQAIQRLVADAALRRTFAERARSRIEAEFSDSVNLDRLVAAFEHARATA